MAKGKKNTWLGVAEIIAGIVLVLPFEDIPAGGATIPLTAVIGAGLAADGMTRL